MKIIVVSGGYEPIHSGHIAYFKAEREYGDKLIVALNSDQWLEDKKGKAFMPFIERKEIISNLSCVDEVINFEDDKYGSAINALDKVKALRGVEYNKIYNPEKSIGVIAQEIEEVIPEVVREDDQGMKSVAYGNITAVLIEAIKAQQKQIDELKSIINGSSG